MGIALTPAMIAISQNPDEASSRRCIGVNRTNSPAENSHRAIVYLARMPRATRSPAGAHAQALPSTIAHRPNTRAHAQQQRNGASIVMMSEQAANAGSDRPATTTQNA